MKVPHPNAFTYLLDLVLYRPCGHMAPLGPLGLARGPDPTPRFLGFNLIEVFDHNGMKRHIAGFTSLTSPNQGLSSLEVHPLP